MTARGLDARIPMGSSRAGVGVQAGRDEIDEEQIEHSAAEADEIDDRGTSAAPPGGGA
jgi:hypothetical protein